MLTVYFLLYLMCVVAFLISDWINLKQLQLAKVPNTHISVRFCLFFQTQDSDFCLTKHHGSIREISYCIILSSSQCRNPVDSKSTKLNTKHFQPGGLRGFKHSGIQKLLCQHIYGRSTVATSMQRSVTLQECFMFWIIFSLSISSSHLLCFTHTRHIYCIYFFPLFLKEKKNTWNHAICSAAFF